MLRYLQIFFYSVLIEFMVSDSKRILMMGRRQELDVVEKDAQEES